MIHQYLADKINTKIKALENLHGGKMRHSKGKLIEQCYRLVVRTTWTEGIGADPRRITISKKKIPYSCKPRENGLLYAEITASQEKSHGIGLDAFVYIDERLVMGSESKSYCDKSMYKRAHGEFESLVAIDPSVNLVIFQAENALGGKIHNKAVCDLTTDQHLLSGGMIHYLTNRTRICKVIPKPTVLTLTGESRSSAKDISAKESPVTAEKIGEIIEFFKKTLGAHA
jgi:hypothetical protein